MTQPSLWPAAVREESDVDAKTAAQIAHNMIQDARRSRTTRTARATARGDVGPAAAAVESQRPPPGPTCTACGAELDPDGTCFMCNAQIRAS